MLDPLYLAALRRLASPPWRVGNPVSFYESDCQGWTSVPLIACSVCAWQSAPIVRRTRPYAVRSSAVWSFSAWHSSTALASGPVNVTKRAGRTTRTMVLSETRPHAAGLLRRRNRPRVSPRPGVVHAGSGMARRRNFRRGDGTERQVEAPHRSPGGRGRDAGGLAEPGPVRRRDDRLERSHLPAHLAQRRRDRSAGSGPR